jgi:nitroreductase
MTCTEITLNRKSIRSFKDEPLGEQVLNNILEAGRLAPTATNQQPWHFIVARGEEQKEACTFGGFNRFAVAAPVVILGIYRQSEAIMEKHSMMDVTIALQNMVIAAWVQGVGSCWMGAFDASKLRDALNLPADATVVGAIALGVPDGQPRQPSKKPLSEIVRYDRW